jgi:hypothetical protein
MSQVILTIDHSGRVDYIAGHGLDLGDQGQTTKQRASHVEPTSWPLRLLFHAIRQFVRDDSAAAGWTRGWPCTWRVRVLGGPCWGTYRNRQQAIAAEVAWLESNRLS